MISGSNGSPGLQGIRRSGFHLCCLTAAFVLITQALSGPLSAQSANHSQAQLFAPAVISVQGTAGSITFTPAGKTAYFGRNSAIMVSQLDILTAAPHPYASSAPLPRPVQFAPGTISTPEQGCLTFTPDGHTVFLAHHTPPPSRLMVSHFQNGAWTVPETLPFSGPNSGRVYDGDPALSPDGLRLFFASKKSESTPTQIWLVTKRGEGWSAPVPVADGICGPPVASDGTLYFCGNKPNSRGGTDMYRSRLVDGKYTPPENLGDAINSTENEYDAYVAPDQSYLIYVSQRPGGPGKSNFYISYQRNGQWTPARLLEVPGVPPGGKVCPVVSPDGQYFFYSTAIPGQAGIYQMDRASLKPTQ